MKPNTQVARIGSRSVELTEFELGRLFERRETRDQLLTIAQMPNRDQQDLLWAWLTDIMDNLPERNLIISIEETYVRFD